MRKLIMILGAAALISLAAACGDDDDDDNGDIFEPTSEEETPSETEVPATEVPTEPTTEGNGNGGTPSGTPGGGSTATTPTQTPSDPDPPGGSVGGCADSAEQVLPVVLGSLAAGNAEAVFNCLSQDARQQFGPTLEDFESGVYSGFAEGLGSFPTDTPVALTAEVGGGVFVTAIRGDREVEGMQEDNAVYAVLAVQEEGSWRMDPTDDFTIASMQPPPFGSVAAGDTAITFDIQGIQDPGEGPGSMGQGEGIFTWLDGTQTPISANCEPLTTPGCQATSASFPDDGTATFEVSVGESVTPGGHFFLVVFVHGGQYAVEGWSFSAS
ncbi:MAG: hypothetical protein GEU28_09885 [Dehalococcoidia bacterium]|nr:hypothetical protein [Dehalococcoidia bacterium]